MILSDYSVNFQYKDKDHPFNLCNRLNNTDKKCAWVDVEKLEEAYTVLHSGSTIYWKYTNRKKGDYGIIITKYKP